MRYHVIFILIVLTTIASPLANIAYSLENLHIVVTFPNLAEDLKPLLCPGDVLSYIAPPGTDPHQYTLTPENIDELKKADIVISTAHAPFEIRIRELKEQGVFKAELIEIPRIPGLTIKKNPVMNTSNYHMPIYDPRNYIVFIKYVANEMAKLNPTCYSLYLEKANTTIEKVEDILEKTPRVNGYVVADTPATQYAIEWTGLRIKYLVVKEHGIEATPHDLETITKAIMGREVNAVVVTSPVKLRQSQWLLQQALKHDIPIIYVSSPLTITSIIDKLENISRQIISLYHNLTINQSTRQDFNHSVFEYGKNVFRTMSIVTGALLYGLIVYILLRREKT